MVLSIRKLTIEDTDNIVKWRNDISVRKNLYSQEELKPEQHINYYNTIVCSGKCAQYIIELSDGDKTKDIGTTFIKNIDLKNKKGEFGMFIGESDERGKGYSVEAVRKTLRAAFSELMLNRVYLTVMVHNIPAIKAYEKAGFKFEGILREDYIRNGAAEDIMEMAILKSEWLKMEKEN